MRDWGPVLAAFALCPLLALLAPTDPAGPLARAVAVGDLEATLGLRFEPATVAWLSERAALSAAAELFYFWAHLPATVGVLVWVWLERRSAFRPARDAFVLTQAATLVINALLPTAPPSMGLAEAPRAAEGGRLVHALQSPFAAMPSGHVAFAVFAAGTLVALVRSWAIRLAAVAYGALVVGVVISTDNHFWLDVAAGSAIAAVAMRTTA